MPTETDLVIRRSYPVSPERIFQHRTVVTLEPAPNGTDVEMRLEPLHDQDWTERILAGRANELDNLQRLIAQA